jgi:cell wall assembly regulator SMI1
MARKILTNDVYFKPFFDEINKYSEGVHNLNEGASSNDIESLEVALRIKLPLNYRKLLELCNGGELFAVPAGTVLSEVYIPSNGAMKRGASYLNESFKKERRWPDMPKSFLIIADTSYGDTICMDLETNNGDEATIVKWNHEEGEVTSSWKRLIDWLMEELEIWAMLVNYDGSDKE